MNTSQSAAGAFRPPSTVARAIHVRGWCAVCRRQAAGLGWFNPRLGRSDPARINHRWVFCSRRCQDAFCKVMTKTEGQMIDPTEMEERAMQSCLRPLGDLVGALGMGRPLESYRREEVLTLIKTIVNTYCEHMLLAHEQMVRRDSVILEQRQAPRLSPHPPSVQASFQGVR